MSELKEEIEICEICSKDELGITWNDGEYDNNVCYKCIDKVRKHKKR